MPDKESKVDAHKGEGMKERVANYIRYYDRNINRGYKPIPEIKEAYHLIKDLWGELQAFATLTRIGRFCDEDLLEENKSLQAQLTQTQQKLDVAVDYLYRINKISSGCKSTDHFQDIEKAYKKVAELSNSALSTIRGK
jgi:hypothetical protein